MVWLTVRNMATHWAVWSATLRGVHGLPPVNWMLHKRFRIYLRRDSKHARTIIISTRNNSVYQNHLYVMLNTGFQPIKCLVELNVVLCCSGWLERTHSIHSLVVQIQDNVCNGTGFWTLFKIIYSGCIWLSVCFIRTYTKFSTSKISMNGYSKLYTCNIMFYRL